ncbi:MAG: CBS domain-containing protein [Firmicutes bacterium]|nr:CBS domain-containing protein [Bacillota bacterium]
MLVGDLMVDAKRTVSGATPVRRVIELLLDDDVDSIPVLSSQGRLEGLVTAGDVLRRCLPGQVRFLDVFVYLNGGWLRGEVLQELGSLPTSQIMSRGIVAVGRGTSVGKAVGLMLEHGLRQLPVVEDEALVGLVGRREVLEMVHTRMTKGVVKT